MTAFLAAWRAAIDNAEGWVREHPRGALGLAAGLLVLALLV